MFKLINGGEKLPTRATRFSAGFDVYSREDKVIGAGCTELIGLGIALDIEIKNNEFQIQHYKRNANSHFLELHLRSSLRAKGLTSLGTGVIDIDYDQEIKMVVHNPISDVNGYLQGRPHLFDFTIKKGDRIGQLILKRHEGYLLPEKYTLNAERNGGFGSSGTR